MTGKCESKKKLELCGSNGDSLRNKNFKFVLIFIVASTRYLSV